MKQNILILSLLFSIATLFASVEEYDTWYFECELEELEAYQLNPLSTVFRSSYGSTFPTTGTFRGLTIFVNIIFDQNDTIYRHLPPKNTMYWQSDVTSSINRNVPTYLLDLFDTYVKPEPHGIITRMFSESSFGKLTLLSDFMVVNIYQSRIPHSLHNGFTRFDLMDAVIGYINHHGGLNAIFEHNSIADYDRLTTTTSHLNQRGREKLIESDYKIDFVNFMVRNTINTTGRGDGAVNFGQVNRDSGFANLIPTVPLLIRTRNPNTGEYTYRTHYFNTGTFQNVGAGNITASGRNILTHELAHFFLGGNESHTSGGGGHTTNTFIGRQLGGYGLYNGMPTANAFERWRLGWVHPSNQHHRIGASGENSDITQFFGEVKIFYLRDFVTYGDAIRIKLPHNTNQHAPNQYIWLVNHQMTRNNKLNYLIRHPHYCRDVNTDGIYAFHQVGRDVLEHTNVNLVFPGNNADNLRVISAEGNYNMKFLGLINDCFGYCGVGVNCRPLFEYTTPNPLSGVNDQTESLVHNRTYNRLDRRYVGAKMRNGVLQNNLPWISDQYDAFVPNPVITMDISTNPTPVNVVTYFSNQNFVPINTNRNTRRIYLTGLSIRMIDPHPANYTGMRTYRVEIRWDDYNVKQDVRWAGDIVMKEQLNLLSGNTIYLEQNRTPNQTRIDPVSGLFAPPTHFTAKNRSVMNLERNSRVILREKSSFILESGANLTIQDGAEIIVQVGSTFMIQSGANLTIQGSGRLVIQEGAFLCVAQGANILLWHYNSAISMHPNAVHGAHPDLFPNHRSCLRSIPFRGLGCVTLNCYYDVHVLQNVTISNNLHIRAGRIIIGNNVTTARPPGDVIIGPNVHLILETNDLIIESGFEMHEGAELEMR